MAVATFVTQSWSAWRLLLPVHAQEAVPAVPTPATLLTPENWQCVITLAAGGTTQPLLLLQSHLAVVLPH